MQELFSPIFQFLCRDFLVQLSCEGSPAQLRAYCRPRLLQMSETALEAEVRQAKNAVAGAEAAWRTAVGESESKLFQVYMVKAKAHEQLMEQMLMQQRAVAGT